MIGNLLETADAIGNRYTFSYERINFPSKIVQPDGSELKFTYDAHGNISTMTDAFGSTRSFVYDDLNHVIKVTDGNGNHTAFTYDSAGNVLQTVNAAGDTRSYQYNESGKVIKITDYDGSTISRQYNALNKPSKLTDQEGNETLLSYDSMWNLARVTEPNGAKTTYLYNEQNRLGRVRKPNGELIRYAYDAAGNCTKYTDEEGNQTGFSYDALGRLVGVTDPEGNETSYTYDAEGNVTKAVDPLGNETKLIYDPAGHLLKETNALGESRSYTYTVLGKIETITDEAGRTTKYIYEPGGRVKEVIYPEGTKESFTYDGNGNVLTHTSVSGFVTTYHYDCLDRVTAISGGNGEKKSYVYDAVGNVTAMTDGAGNTTTYKYTPAGHLKKVTDALGNETAYDYDVCGRLVKIRQYGDASDKTSIDEEFLKVQQWNQENRHKICQVTSYERDLSGQVTRITDALGQEEVYTYGKRGELFSKTDKDGYLTSYGYTVSGELNRIRYADGREVRLSYNALRQLEEMEDWLGITRITNDPLGRVTKTVYPNGEEVVYTYGKAGERTSLTYPDGKTVNYEYDELIRLKTLKDGEAEIRYAYDPMGRLAKKTFPNGMETSYRYDEKGQIQKLIHEDREGIVDAYTYRYDLLGNKTGIEKQRRGLETESGSYAYTYDKLGRLSDVSRDGEVLRSYTYDAFGNRIGLFAKGQETRYHYNSLNQLLSKEDQHGQESYTYDQRGNLTQIRKNGTLQNSYVYGAINRLEKAFNGKGELAQYEYNGLGYRVGKSIGKASTAEIPAEPIAIPDPERQIRYTIDLTRQYHNLLQKEENGQNQTYLWDGNVAGFTEGESAQYYFQDELGSPVRLADTAGKLTEAYGYDEFGADLYGTQGKAQPFGYTGYQYDHVAGTYFAQAREYQPVVGRFMARDIMKGNVEDRISQNEYLYCREAPLDYVDLNGEIVISSTLLIIGIGIGAGTIGSAAINATSQEIKIWKGEQEKFKWGELTGAAVEGAIIGGTSAIPALGPVLSIAASIGGGAVGSTMNSLISQKVDNGEINPYKVVEDAFAGLVTSVAFYGIGKVVDPIKSQIKTTLGLSTAMKETSVIKNEVKNNTSALKDNLAKIEAIKEAGKVASSLTRKTQLFLVQEGRELSMRYVKAVSKEQMKKFAINAVQTLIGYKSFKSISKDILKILLPIYMPDNEESVLDYIKNYIGGYEDLYHALTEVCE